MMNYQGEDRISDLPDGVLHTILSFLDLKPAIRTCILSSRWRYVWRSHPFLDFNCEQFLYFELRNNVLINHNIDGFDDFVDHVLNLRDKSSVIRRFHLSLYYHTNHSDTEERLYRWIVTALNSYVEDLYLQISVSEEFKLPECLFYCKTLGKFELQLCGKEPIRKLDLPHTMSLPGLKILVLGAVRFEGVNVPNKILEACPLLESLTFSDCVFEETRLKIYAPKLKHFVILNNDSVFYENDHFYEDGVVDINKYTIKIYAPNLLSFRCWDFMSKKYILEDLSSLVKAELDMEIEEYLENEDDEAPELDDDTRKEYVQQMIKFLSDVHNVETLKLSACFVEVVSGAPALLESTPIKFCNLKYLRLDTSLSRDCINAIMYLLKIAPIESIYLEIVEVKLDSAKVQGDWEASVSLQFVLYHLKFVKIQGVCRRLNEFMFLKTLLKNGMVLEKVLVHTSRDLTPNSNTKSQRVNFRKQLLALPRASSGIKFVFY